MKFKTLSEIAREAAQHPYDDRPYRRGFHQGYNQALDDFERAMSQMSYRDAVRSINTFYNRAVTRWRNTGNPDQMTPPPFYSPDQWPAIQAPESEAIE